MSYILNQKRFLNKRNFEITSTSLKISVTRPFKYYEDEFSFEEIGRRVFKTTRPNRYSLIVSLICLFGLIITLYGILSGDKSTTWEDTTFYIAITPLALFMFWLSFTNTTNLMLADKRYIVFYRNLPNKAGVSQFIDLIFSEQKTYLVNKYTKREQFMSNEQLMDQLLWLKNKNIISELEFEDFKKGFFPPVGFTFNNTNS